MPTARAGIGRDDKLTQILDAAQARLLAGGYDGMSVAAIARDLGLAANTIYWYFGSKDALLAAVARRLLTAQLATKPDGRDPVAKVLWTSDKMSELGFLRTLVSNRAPHSAAAAARSPPPPSGPPSKEPLPSSSPRHSATRSLPGPTSTPSTPPANGHQSVDLSDVRECRERRDVDALGDDTHDHPLRARLGGRGGTAHVKGVHLLVKRPARVVGELCRACDGGVVRAVARVAGAVDGQAVNEQVHPRVAAHVDRLAAASDGAEQDVVASWPDEDHRRLGLAVSVGGGQDTEMRAVEDVADGRAEDRVSEMSHTSVDSRGGAEESRGRPIPFRDRGSQHGDANDQ